MNPIDLHDMQFLHSFYVASPEKDLDAAFEDGKSRALKCLESQLNRIRTATREKYEACFGVNRHE